MTVPQPATGPASRSGVRRFGDHYQDLIGWIAALRVLHPGNDFHRVEIEVNGVGNIDDVVLRSTSGRHRYTQVKWTTNSTNMIDNEYLIKQDSDTSKSLLQKFFTSWKKLANGAEPPVMELVTNRVLDPADPLLSLLDGRTDLLNPAARRASPRTLAGKRLAEWAAHLRCTSEEVVDMLDNLLFKPGQSVNGECDRAQSLMLANGLLGDADALDRGVGMVTGWVLHGRRQITPDDINTEIDRLRLRAGDPRAVLLVQAINRDPNPEDALVALDWVDLYEGDSPPTRRQPRDPVGWATMSAELDRAVARLSTQRLRDVVVRGAMRQATFFAVGARLAQVTGTNITYIQHGTPWPSDAPRVAVPPPEQSLIPIDAGADLAVAMGMTVDPTPAVTKYLNTVRLPVRSLLVLMPSEGAHDQSVAGPGQAVAYTQALRNAVRAQLETAPSDQVHLFLAGPGGLALLLGHRWNRVAPTTVYDDLGPGRGYVEAFTVAA
ncbi:MAG: SAVED domain-containing protein [Pseudonocardiaceae bacterium]